jgi:hypothetical protein
VIGVQIGCFEGCQACLHDFYSWGTPDPIDGDVVSVLVTRGYFRTFEMSHFVWVSKASAFNVLGFGAVPCVVIQICSQYYYVTVFLPCRDLYFEII